MYVKYTFSCMTNIDMPILPCYILLLWLQNKAEKSNFTVFPSLNVLRRKHVLKLTQLCRKKSFVTNNLCGNIS
ncbi:hypothetical protein XELAEV_18005463mg [Xenopus laevis]|uniref:Uncharacterized protein n=1 Tax=Xenopus laevis TaxID=8355 RepID=A0A974I349_XENLA|nr:hypothetical protein XELAEV_18005463mg [Xenopus laevis]